MISSKAKVHPSVTFNCSNIEIGDNVIINEGVIFNCNSLKIKSNAIVEKNCFFNFKEVDIGYKAVVQENSKFRALTGMGDFFLLGDFSFLGYSQNLLVPRFIALDYTTIHNSCFITGFEACKIGYNCWIGQNTILNSNKELLIGNNVGIGTNSQLWTHVIHGELLEGCTMFGEHPLIIEDDVWIVGGAVISPNLIVRKKSVIMVGSVLTKSTEEGHCYAGVPAKDITDKLNPYKPTTLDEKFEMMKSFSEEFLLKNPDIKQDQVIFVDNISLLGKEDNSNDEKCIIVKEGSIRNINSWITLFSIQEKTYTKNLTSLEERFMKFHERYRAKFIPL